MALIRLGGDKQAEDKYAELESACMTFLRHNPCDGFAWQLDLADSVRLDNIQRVIQKYNPSAFEEKP